MFFQHFSHAVVWKSKYDLAIKRSKVNLGDDAVAKRRIQDNELAGSIPANTKCCVLEQVTLSTLLSAGFYPRRPACNTHKMKVLQYI